MFFYYTVRMYKKTTPLHVIKPVTQYVDGYCTFNF